MDLSVSTADTLSIGGHAAQLRKVSVETDRLMGELAESPDLPIDESGPAEVTIEARHVQTGTVVELDVFLWDW